MEALLGGTLLSKDGKKPTKEALAGTEVVGLYFSAHWCPPCRGFTPTLVAARNELQSKLNKPFEVVFVSSDRDQGQFDEYYGEMPWLALPFEDRDKKAELSKRFKVRGIPTLVIVDAKTGETITTDGRSAVSDLEAYPWIPPTLNDLLGGGFRDASGAAVTVAELCEREAYLGLYFSAHWCPPCKRFTPELAKAYKAVKAAGNDLTIAFVSSDNSKEEFDEYFAEMPWHCLPFEERSKKQALSNHFDVSGIPSFVMLKCGKGGEIEVVNRDARGPVGNDETPGESFPWAPPLWNELSNCDESIEDTPSIVAFMEEAGDEWEKCQAALAAVSQKVKDNTSKGCDAPFRFWAAQEVGGPAGQIRKLCKLDRPKQGEVQLVILNLSDDGAFHIVPTKGCTETQVQALVDGYGDIVWDHIKK